MHRFCKPPLHATGPGSTLASHLAWQVQDVLGSRARRSALHGSRDGRAAASLLRGVLPPWRTIKRHLAKSAAAHLRCSHHVRGNVVHTAASNADEIVLSGHEAHRSSLTEQPQPVRHLLVEGAEADDIAAFICRSGYPLAAAHVPAAAGAADQPSASSAACAGAVPQAWQRPVILLTADRDWLQFQARPNIHCLDLFGAVRRPEWLLAHQRNHDAISGCITLAERQQAYQEVATRVQQEVAAAAAEHGPNARLWLCHEAALSATWQSLQVRPLHYLLMLAPHCVGALGSNNLQV